MLQFVVFSLSHLNTVFNSSQQKQMILKTFNVERREVYLAFFTGTIERPTTCCLSRKFVSFQALKNELKVHLGINIICFGKMLAYDFYLLILLLYCCGFSSLYSYAC